MRLRPIKEKNTLVLEDACQLSPVRFQPSFVASDDLGHLVEVPVPLVLLVQCGVYFGVFDWSYGTRA